VTGTGHGVHRFLPIGSSSIRGCRCPGTLPGRCAGHAGRDGQLEELDELDEPEDPDELGVGAGFEELLEESEELLVVLLLESLLDSPLEPLEEPLVSPDEESEPDPVDGLVELDLPRLSVL
jgi:hypothetical protein